jgi:hypothetical protein
VVYAREMDDEIYRFGVAGLDQGTMIMYDAETGSHWSQLVGAAVSGEMTGRRLEKLPSALTTWGRWRELHPDTTVYVKRSIPYGARFTGKAFASVAEAEEGPVRPVDLVIGVEGHVEARAYLARRLAAGGRLVHDELEGTPIAVFLSEDLATARVYDRRLDDRTLRLELAAGDRLRDVETGSIWEPLSGEAIAGPLKGRRLQPLVSTYSLWFAWHKYRPDTSLHGEPPDGPENSESASNLAP